MKKLWVVSEMFYPDETSTSFILTKISEKLTTKYDVNVITCTTDINIKSHHPINISELNINRYLKKLPNCKNNLLFRTYRLLLISIVLTIITCFKVSRKDKVLIVTNPAPLLVLISILKRIKKFDLTIIVHDIFPENSQAINLIDKDNLFYKLLLSIFNNSYSKADLIIVLGRDMKDVIYNKIKNKKNIPKIEIIENWAEDQIKFSKKLHIKNEIVLQYAGNIGRAQALVDFIERFILSNNKLIKLEIWGKGALENKVKEVISLSDKKNIKFFGAFSRNEQNKIYHRCDISVISMRNEMYGLGVPSKTYNILSSGKPILYIGNKKSEVALLINEFNIGYCFDNCEKEQLTEFLNSINCNTEFLADLHLKSENAKKLINQKYSQSLILEKYFNLV